MRKKPLIGLNADYRSAKKDSPAFTYLAAGYYDCIQAVGGIPVILPPQADADDTNQILDQLDGVVLVGGADLDPRNDGFMLHPSARLVNSRREQFDRLLTRLVAKRRIPVFGIGSGMQLLNLTLGGNLFLHLPEDLPKAIPHFDSLDPAHRHGLEVVPGTLMERVFGEGEIRVNSMHHMAIDELAPGLLISARSPDGVIESFESKDSDWWVLGTQFHPEAESASAIDIRIFEEWIVGITGEVPQALQLAAA
ncbi:MAG: gamma-glutamyl-gamma-aminobutyrate hydrolase family protein [Pirellulales bacterium]|nr:gamma-glutamyl-gamma-aminobutyrate hydrolase family protein [Pirellulales bacterium]